MQDYGNMVRQLMQMATPVADKTNPLNRGLFPNMGTEGGGVMGTGGGGRAPAKRMTVKRMRELPTEAEQLRAQLVMLEKSRDRVYYKNIARAAIMKRLAEIGE
jgi:hypothetical protein